MTKELKLRFHHLWQPPLIIISRYVSTWIRAEGDTSARTFETDDTLIAPNFDFIDKVIEPGPDRTVGPENPRTVQIYGRFKVRNHSMRKKHGTVRTAV